jgi:hypothetical protein
MLSSRYRRIVGRASVLTWVLRATVFDRTGLAPDPIREQFVLNEEYLQHAAHHLGWVRED